VEKQTAEASQETESLEPLATFCNIIHRAILRLPEAERRKLADRYKLQSQD
jgi:hypothetical protein